MALPGPFVEGDGKSTAGLIVGSDPSCAREFKGLAERDKIVADRGEFAGSRTVGIGHDWR